MQTSTENVDSQNMTQDLSENESLYELNKKVNGWNMALNSKQEIKIPKNTQADDKKRRETSVKNLIGYEWKEASNGAKIEVVNPATSELIDTVPNVTEEDVDEAVKVAMVESVEKEK